MSVQDQYCIVVDAYSSGNLIAPEFKRRGYKSLHITSIVDLPTNWASSFKPQDFSAQFVFSDDYEALLAQLRPYQLACIIPGAESGVPIADQLSERLNLPGNGLQLSGARRSKYLMHETLHNNGIQTLHHCLTVDYEKAIAFAKQVGWPVVAKPMHSAGTDSVFLCSSAQELQAAFNYILHKVNVLGLLNEAVLLQEFIRGTEYIIDTVSADGKHYVTDFVKYHKKKANDRNFIYDCEELLPPQGPLQDQLEQYVFRILTALGVRVGAVHTEVIVTERGPVFVEMGARLNGGYAPILISECTGDNIVSRMIDGYLTPQYLCNHFGHRYRLKKYGLFVYLIAERDGIVKALPMLETVQSLESFFRCSIVQPGQRVLRTVDLCTHAGQIELIHEDPDQLWRDYRAIRDFEHRGFYHFS